MKIGMDIRATQLGHGGRGIGKYIFDLVEGVSRLGREHQFVLIALPDKPLPSRLASLPANCRVSLLPTPLMKPFSWSQPVRYIWRVKYLRTQRTHGKALARLAARERLDVLHQLCVADTTFFPGSRPSCRLVQTFYDAIPIVFPDFFFKRWPAAQEYVYHLQVADCRKADIVVAISESAGRDAEQYAKVAPAKVRVVYPAVPEEFTPVTDPARLDDCFARLGVRPPYFLFCSASDPTKNVAGLLQGFGEFIDEWPERYQIVMVTKETEELKRLAYEADVPRKRVLFTGFVSDEDLVTLYSGAVALVSPSLYEGFGLPVAQAMRAGTPVIASDRSSQPEVVGDAGLLVDPEDAGAITAAMRRLAGDPALRECLAARGRERVQRFDWQHQAQAMLDIYTSQANGKKKK